MDKIFSNFHMNTEFFILIGLFVTLTLLITTIILIFITKIKGLNAILEQAKEIDKAKIAKIKSLEEELESYKLKKEELEKEIKFLPKNRERLDDALRYIEQLREQMAQESKEHIDLLHKQKLDFEQLSVHYELLNRRYTKLEDRYQRLKDRNSVLIDNNNILYSKIRDIEVKMSENARLKR